MFNRFADIPLYRGRLGLIISNDLDDIKQIAPEFETNEIYAHTQYHDSNGIEAFSIILNFENETKIKYGTIAHECYHVVSMILSNRGVIADFDNDESAAYLMEWVFDKVIDWLKEAKVEL